jgi:hypothetical protein
VVVINTVKHSSFRKFFFCKPCLKIHISVLCLPFLMLVTFQRFCLLLNISFLVAFVHCPRFQCNVLCTNTQLTMTADVWDKVNLWPVSCLVSLLMVLTNLVVMTTVLPYNIISVFTHSAGLLYSFIALWTLQGITFPLLCSSL